mgnify:CR=1 FL=1
MLEHFGVVATGRRDAPGVYVDGAKIAALGLRVRRGCTFHGLAFNIDMDLEPFDRINPCGFEDLRVTQLSSLCEANIKSVESLLLEGLVEALGYNNGFVDGPSVLP